jgi:hypothetical protein
MVPTLFRPPTPIESTLDLTVPYKGLYAIFFDDIKCLFFFTGRFNIDTSINQVALFLVVFGES